MSGVTGGVVVHFKSAVDTYLALTFEDPKLTTMSESTIYNMLSDAGIKFGKIKKTFSIMRLDQHFAAATLKYVMNLAILFSKSVR